MVFTPSAPAICFFFIDGHRSRYKLNSEPKALTGDNPRVLKAEAQPRLLSEDLFPVKAEGEEFNVLILSYTREFSRPFKENKGSTTVSEEQGHQVRRQLVCWRCALVNPYFSVFFPPVFVESQMAQVDRLRSFERGVLGSSSLCDGSFVAVFTLFFFK